MTQAFRRRTKPRAIDLLFVLLLVSLGRSAAASESHKATPAEILADLSHASRIEAVQPPYEVAQRLDQQAEVGRDNARSAADFDPRELVYGPGVAIVKNDLPYYPYASLKAGSQNVIHPMALGRFLYLNATSTIAQRLVTAALTIAAPLPNGGLAWYYPKHYHVSRMLGDRFKYSALAQGTLITGLTIMALKNPDVPMKYAQSAYAAMEWPFERGGVNLAGRAVLEMPSFAGPPEIILNGWLDAMLHIREFAQMSDDAKAQEFFRRNVAFLASILPSFDAPDAHISRYSDVSPYQVKLTLKDAKDFQGIEVLYRPLLPGLQPLRVPLLMPAPGSEISSYDNHLVRQNGRKVVAWISCSQHYDTVIVARSKSLAVDLEKGEVKRRQATPGGDGGQLRIEGQALDEARSYASFGSRDGLICGYPTNFSKGGTTNYYHVYHVVALMLLALGNDVEPAAQKELLRWAFNWKADIDFIASSEHLPFHDAHDVLSRTIANQSRSEYESFEKLEADARQRLESLK